MSFYQISFIIYLVKQAKLKKENFTMSIRKELNLARFEHITEKQVYMMGDLIFLVGHIIYLCIFRLFNITPMEYYNYFSVIFYAVMLLILQKIKKTNEILHKKNIEIKTHSRLTHSLINDIIKANNNRRVNKWNLKRKKIIITPKN